ncbi:S8 family serine peptidase [Lysobacter korlensis]|uniref:S8 family serine peptidase n=1 Tax=Lysobacter korlensis TaxID=553636 RepID=A0ABV6RXD9_9GAMM
MTTSRRAPYEGTRAGKRAHRWGIATIGGVLAAAMTIPALVPVQAAAAAEAEEYLVSVAGDAEDFRRTVTSVGGVVEDVFGRLDVLAVTMPPAAAASLDRRPDVEVEPNVTFHALDTRVNPPSYGLDRVDQRRLPLSGSYSYPSTARGAGVHVYILDSGIRADHAEFGGRVAGGFGAVADGRGTSDCNGHGTHVAGTVAGSTVGIAPAATLIPVRILDCSGRTSSGWEFMDGMDWILAHHRPGKPAVLNMSIGAQASSMIDSVVADAVADGIVVVAAAGNSSTSACYSSPARAASAITVAATGITDARASYSNYGSCVDIFAPGGDNGAGIRSAYSTSSTALASLMGTSMATPHVAGVAARYLSAYPAATPAQVTSALLGTATTGAVASAGSGSPNRLLYADPAGFPGSTGAPSDGSADTQLTAPAAPTGVTAAATGNDDEALVSWTAPSSTGGAAITDYVVTISPKLATGASSRSAGTATSLVFPGIDGGPHTFTVTASNGSAVSAPSVKSNAITLSPGTLTSPVPVVKGTAAAGHLLAAAPGTWGPAPVALTFQWLRDGVAIPAATSSTYRVSRADAGRLIAVTVTGAKAGYTTTSTTSPARAIAHLLTGTPTPAISGSNRVGHTVTASPGEWGPAPVTLRYQWNRSGKPIPGATWSTYRLTSADAGRTVTVTVRGSKSGYSSASKTSAGKYVTKVLTKKPTPTITGSARVGSTLRADAGTWGPSPVTLRYQWNRSGKPIAGATSKSYRLTAGDAGKRITVKVTGVKSGYGSVSKISASLSVPTGWR